MFRLISHYVPDPILPCWMPRTLQRLLVRSERYRAWVRRQPLDASDDPESAPIPEYPKWALAASCGGWETCYTRLGERRFRLSLLREPHLMPPFHIDLEVWSLDPYNQMPFTPKGTVARHWQTIQEFYLPTLEEAEAEHRRLKRGLEELLMEQSL